MGEAEQLPLEGQPAARPSPSAKAQERRPSPSAKARAKPRAKPLAPTAERLPIARVRVDAVVPHLDRDFDYSVPASMDDDAQPGVRVRVRLAGRLVGAVILSRHEDAAIEGALRSIDRIVSPEPVLTPQTLALVEAVAERYAGTFSDVVRLAVPPRHARAEASVPVAPPAPVEIAPARDTDGLRAWAEVDGGLTLVDRARAGGLDGARATWSMPPARDWAAMVASMAHAVLEQPSGGVLVVVPDAADTDRLWAALGDLAPFTAVLRADHGPERRYREFLRVLRGHARLVIGTRTAVFAPVRDLALTIVWNDGEDTLWEPHAPSWNARDVAALRAHLGQTALLVGSPARTVETQGWVERGWATSMDPARDAVRARGPVVRAVEPGDLGRDEAAASARIPHVAWLVAQEGLRTGPVLVQVGRRGYVGALACQGCRELAVCPGCGGPLAIGARGGVPSCSWCAASAGAWACRACGGTRLRALAIGAERTAEEIGRAFPGARVTWSTGQSPRREVGVDPAIVVATPGAEPVADGGYAAVVLLDAQAALARPGLRAQEDALARWFGAAVLARPGAQVAIAAPNALPVVQALVRWDAAWFAARELAERTAAGLPPATRMAVLRGPSGPTAEVLHALELPHRALGPVDDRTIVVVDREHAGALARRLRAIAATRAAQRSGEPVTARLDPREP